MNILGLNGYFNADHDAGAAVVIHGEVVAAVEEERLVRQRRATGLPPHQSAAEVLDLAGLAAEEIDALAYGWNPVPLRLDPVSEAESIRAALRQAGIRVRPGVPVEFVDHHVAHAWSALAFLDRDEYADCELVVLDGSGETTSGAGFGFRGGALTRRWHLPLASSLGIFYEGVTRALGFGWGCEGKTMGLAAYGRPAYRERLPMPPDDRFDGPLPDWAEDYQTVLANVTATVRGVCGRHPTFVERADLAASAQALLQERIQSWVRELEPLPPVVALAGGIALNCTANGALAAELAARGTRLSIPPPASDTGIALGAAAAVAARTHPPSVPAGAYLGRPIAPGEVAGRVGAAAGCVPVELAARLWEDDAVVGWFEGRAEVGPRALGRRCLVARPDSSQVRDRINVLKGRESWRPLAPSVSAQEFRRSFDGVASRYMLRAAMVRPEARPRLAGVTHADGSARPQVVTDGSAYARLLAAVGHLSGTEALVCTSFNLAGEPMVYTLEDGLRAARAMRLDALAGPGWLVDLRGRP